MFADVKPLVLLLWINRADAHSRYRLLHFDLNFLGEGLGFLVRTGLGADDGRNLDFASGFAVNFDLAEFVLDANGLSGA